MQMELTPPAPRSKAGFLEELRAFSDFGKPTHEESRAFGRGMVPVFFNEFWTSRQRAGHSIHEISYRACYKPQLPAFFLTRLTRPGDLVYDPFMGRGTTLVEARLHGCRVAGNDANPLATALVAPRLDPPPMREIAARIASVDLSVGEEADPELLVFFAPETLREITAWRAYFRRRLADGTFDRTDAWIRMVACNRLTGHSPGFFSVYTLPPNQATSVTAQRRINEKRNQTPGYRDTRAILLKKSAQLLRDPLPAGYATGDSLLLADTADDTPRVPSGSVKLVVTSPPFLDTVDYIGDNRLRTWFCELTPDPGRIWMSRSVGEWTARMRAVFAELHRVLRPDGHIAFEVGEVRKGSLALENEVVAAGAAAGLEPVCILINSQSFTKTANCWGVANNENGTNSNRITIFRKADS